MGQIEQTTEIINKAVQIVTIKSLGKLYKNGEEALRIELANCEEHGFNIIVEKGLYEVGDNAIYVQPDFTLPLVDPSNPSLAQELFSDFTQPEGDGKKSKLGKNGRIRAIKFNFNTEPNGVDPVYSMGIMLPLKMVLNQMNITQITDPTNLDELLEVSKYEEPESAYSGMSKGALPVGMYSTDETNFLNMERVFEDKSPLVLIGSIKVDGSSESLYFKNENEFGICSRNLEKKLDQTQIIGYKDEDGNNVRKHYDRDLGVKGWLCEATSKFYTEIPDTFTTIESEVDDTFVKLGKPVLEKLKAYCIENSLQLALRGELCGEGLKGSGNKNNPHSKLKQQILFYGADDYSEGVTRKLPAKDFYDICKTLEISYCDIVFEKEFNSIDEIKEECDNYFKTNLIEGIVLRSLDSRISCKYMNLEYDSKK